MSGDNWLGS